MSIPEKYKPIISKGVLASLAAGPLGAFGGIDTLAVGGIWTTMFVSIADKAGKDLDEEYVKKFITSAATGAVAYYAGCKAATWLFHLIPGGGTLLAMGASTIMNAIYTLKFGSGVAHSFEKGQLDFSDAAVAATSVLAALCTIPSMDEWKDLIQIHNINA